MPAYIAFLRAVNVGGRFVRMAELRESLTAAGFGEVATHIQSGNVLVTSRRRSCEAVAADLRATLSDRAGFDIPAIVRTPAQLRATVRAVRETPALLSEDARRNEAFADRAIPDEAAQTLASWSREGERAVVVRGDSVLAELGVDFHKSTMTNARIERLTGCTTTWRDLKVVRDLDERWGA